MRRTSLQARGDVVVHWLLPAWVCHAARRRADVLIPAPEDDADRDRAQRHEDEDDPEMAKQGRGLCLSVARPRRRPVVRRRR